jgi:chromosome segregation ATPase
MAQTKQNFGQMNQKLAAGTKEIQELKAERDSLKQQVDSSIEGAGQSKNAEIQRLNQQVASLSALKAQLEASLASANAVQKALEEEKAQIASQLDVIVSVPRFDSSNLLTGISKTSLTKERDALQAELKSRVEQGATGDGAAPASAGADVEKLMQELNEAKAREAVSQISSWFFMMINLFVGEGR